MQELVKKAKELLTSGKIDIVLGWRKGELPFEIAPAFFSTQSSLDDFVYNGFSTANLSKYLVDRHEKILIFLKPCDTYSLNQLLAENRVKRENIYTIGIGCRGTLDIKKIRGADISGILNVTETGETLKVSTMYGNSDFSRKTALQDKCLACKGKEHMIYDELMLTEISDITTDSDKFAKVQHLENENGETRYNFWRRHLGDCIRCNTCRNVCPACTCRKCVFDNPHSGVAANVNTREFEENLFHIIRGYHVAGRCTDCGECSRVCPQDVPLDLINRKFIKDINQLYGNYQAGETPEFNSPLLKFDQNDPESKGGSNV